jgi:hypothetical protein
MGKVVLVTTKNPEEAREAYLNYIEKTGLYARIVTQNMPTGDGSKQAKMYVVYGYDEPCRLNKYLPDMTHGGLHILAGMYLRLTKLKVAFDLMSRSPMAPKVVSNMMSIVTDEKRDMTGMIQKIIEPHPITKWCSIISGGGKGATIGTAAAIVFLGYVDPHEAPTAGKARKYWGYYPGGVLKHGQKVDFNPWIKGVGHFTAKRVVMGRDSYYRPLFDAKKEYYVSRNAPRPNMMALRWLASLLVSHAQQIIREAEGYTVPRHRMHIEPKSQPGETPPKSIIEAIRTGAVAKYWENKKE